LLHLFDEAAFDKLTGNFGVTLFDLSGKSLAQEDYPLPERTQETLENALFNAIPAASG
jgi:hypothetical protein